MQCQKIYNNSHIFIQSSELDPLTNNMYWLNIIIVWYLDFQ